MRLMGERGLHKKRQQLLEGISGNILEVGAGTGANFPIYPKDCTVLACEPAKHMFKRAKSLVEVQDFQAKIEVIHAGIGSPDLEKHIPTQGLDAIVCALVLCTIPYPGQAIDQMLSWLKPDGELYVLEHIHPHQSNKQKIFNLVNPIWTTFSEGCQLNRPTDILLKTKAVKPLDEHYFGGTVPFYMARLVKV